MGTSYGFWAVLVALVCVTGCGDSEQGARGAGGNAGGGGGGGGGGGSGGVGMPVDGVSFHWFEPIERHVMLAAESTERMDLETRYLWANPDGSVVVGQSILSRYSGSTYVDQEIQLFRWTEESGTADLGRLPGAPPDPPGMFGFRDLSDDGLVIVGMTVRADGSQTGFRWTPESGMEELPAPDGMTIEDVTGVSTDGKVVIGTLARTLPTDEVERRAVRWLDSGMELIEPAADHSDTFADGLNADASVIWGSSFNTDAGYSEPFRWSPEAGVVSLGVLPTGTGCGGHPGPKGSTADVLFGSCQDEVGDPTAFRWTQASGIQSLGAIPGYKAYTFEVMSADGAVAAGQAQDASGLTQVFYWREDSGMTGLGFLPGHVRSMAAFGRTMSADGSVVVGRSADPQNVEIAFRWTEERGMQSLAPLAGDERSQVLDLSAEGLVAAGQSYFVPPTQDPTDGMQAVTWDAEGKPSSIAASLTASGVDLDGARLFDVWLSRNDGTLLGDGALATGEHRGFVVRRGQ